MFFLGDSQNFSREEFVRGFAKNIANTTERLCFSREEFVRGFAPNKGDIK